MERTEILNTLKLAAPALLPDSEVVLPILKNFKFAGGQVITSNDVIAVCLAADIGVEGTVPGKKLLTFLSSCNTKDAGFSSTKKGNMVVKCGKSRLTLTPEDDDWPFEFPDIDAKGTVTYRTKEGFFEALDMCSSLSPDTGTANWSGGIMLEFGKALEVFGVGKGRVTISYYRVDEMTSKKKRSEMLTSSFCKAAVAMSKTFGTKAKLHINKEASIIEWGDGENIIAGKFVNAETPDIPGRFGEVVSQKMTYIGITDTIKEVFKRAAAISDKGSCIVYVEDGQLRLKAKSDVGASLLEVLKDSTKMKDLNVDVAADLVVKHLGDCEQIAFSEDATVLRTKDERFVYVAANREGGEDDE